MVIAPIIKGPEIAPRAAATLIQACAIGRHLRGRISDGTAYARGTAANPKPIRVCAAMSRYMLPEPGAMAAPINEMRQLPTRSSLRAWKVSDAEEMSGEMTACTSESEFGTHVWA